MFLQRLFQQVVGFVVLAIVEQQFGQQAAVLQGGRQPGQLARRLNSGIRLAAFFSLGLSLSDPDAEDEDLEFPGTVDDEGEDDL